MTTMTTQIKTADTITTEDPSPGSDKTPGEIQGLIVSTPHHGGSQDCSIRAEEDYPESEMDDMDWDDLEQLPLKGTIIRIKQREKTPSPPQDTSPHSGQDTRQRNFEGQRDTSTNRKLGASPNQTDVIHNAATNTTDRTMQPSEIPWTNKDPHLTTTPHHSRKEECRNTEDDHSDWEVDNLDWNVLEHPPHRGTITDNILQELTPQFEEVPSPPLNNPQLIKKKTTEKEKQAPNHGGIPHERPNS